MLEFKPYEMAKNFRTVLCLSIFGHKVPSARIVLACLSPISLPGDTPLFMGHGLFHLHLICAFSALDSAPHNISNVSL